MADLHPILATRDQAAAIGQLIRSTGETDLGSGVATIAAPEQCLVVQLETAISAGSTAQVWARIYTLAGSTWTDTKQRVQVRSATGAAVSTTGRRIARQCSRFGYVVVET